MAPRKATLCGSDPVGSGSCGTRGRGTGVTCGASVVGCGAGRTSHTPRVNANSKPQHQVMTRAEVGSTTYLSMLNQGSCHFYTLPHAQESKVTTSCANLPTAFGRESLRDTPGNARLTALGAGNSNPSLAMVGLKEKKLFGPSESPRRESCMSLKPMHHRLVQVA